MRLFAILPLFAIALAGNHDDLQEQFGDVRPQRSWDEAYELAGSALARLTTQEKIQLTTGTGLMVGNCAGNIREIKKLGLPWLCFQDGPVGVRSTDQVTVFPAGVTAASTFDKQLMYLRSRAMGVENRLKGVNVALAPSAGGLGRAPAAGRTWEGFGPDPYLSGIGNAESVKGLQDEGVIACAKHWVANEQERYRLVIENLLSATTPPITHSISSEVDARTLRELYEWPFVDAVDAGVASIMCAYQRVNGVYSCEDKMLTSHLKSNASDNLGFKGFVVTDWFAAALPSKASEAGTDVVMPGDLGLMGVAARTKKASDGALDPAKNTRLDEAAFRVLAAWYKLNQDKDYPKVNFAAFNNATNGFILDRFFIGKINHRVDASKPIHAEVARRIAEEGTVLLKNEGSLPLSASKTKKIAVFGSDAGPIPKGPNSCGEFHTCSKGILAVGWGSGAGTFETLIDPLAAIRDKARDTDATVTAVLDDFDYAAVDKATAEDPDVCLTFIQSRSGEGLANVEGNVGDRNNLTAWYAGDELVKRVASNCANTVVVIHTVGPIIMEPWIEHPNVTAVLAAHLPGQDAGTPLVELLYGDKNPSGKLPYTVGKTEEDYCCKVQSEYTGPAPKQEFTEGTAIDYRWFEQKNITPRFGFGFGLSYTTFSYSDSLSIKKSTLNSPLPDTPHATPLLTVTTKITNSGSVKGKEVAQLYVTYPAGTGSGRWLRGFDKIELEPGKDGEVRFELRKRDLSYWDVKTERWTVAPGKYKIEVGGSSRDVKAVGEVSF